MIEATSVSKSFGTRKVLNNLSFLVPDGQTFALLGLSGSGKTTALKVVCGLQHPDTGLIHVQNIPVRDKNLMKIRAQIGYVIQDGGLFPHLTAYENLRLVGREFGWTADRIRSRVEDLAALTRMSPELLPLYPRQLSGGQRQRVGLMRALLLDPPILLLDEPMGALDPITRHELQTELRELFTRLKKTVLLVTHDLYEAGYLAHRILLLNEGRVLQEGTMDDLVQCPADDFVSRFVKSQMPHSEAQ